MAQETAKWEMENEKAADDGRRTGNVIGFGFRVQVQVQFRAACLCLSVCVCSLWQALREGAWPGAGEFGLQVFVFLCALRPNRVSQQRRVRP